MSGHVLLNLLNKLRKGDKIRGVRLAEHFNYFFRNVFNKFIEKHSNNQINTLWRITPILSELKKISSCAMVDPSKDKHLAPTNRLKLTS